MHVFRSFAHSRAIRRAGIPFGPEVSDTEAASGKTAIGQDGAIPRGLAFTCYQSIIQNGFEFLQESESVPCPVRPQACERNLLLTKK